MPVSLSVRRRLEIALGLRAGNEIFNEMRSQTGWAFYLDNRTLTEERPLEIEADTPTVLRLAPSVSKEEHWHDTPEAWRNNLFHPRNLGDSYSLRLQYACAPHPSITRGAWDSDICTECIVPVPDEDAHVIWMSTRRSPRQRRDQGMISESFPVFVSGKLKDHGCQFRLCADKPMLVWNPRLLVVKTHRA